MVDDSERLSAERRSCGATPLQPLPTRGRDLQCRARFGRFERIREFGCRRWRSAGRGGQARAPCGEGLGRGLDCVIYSQPLRLK
ncbi:hypothetical protein SAMCFNEI73_Ch0312 [Sinorhizobium americanum]|uniref:Uncharacterized protein n=1 Tax=Sinorhizobium americanum TaxID=194963 RepID=A0A1L3LHQ5_9HYPH|nr:hypothetical protein SAMCCGM7_Ch0314 [Sinorhizobium americanum CCGM7]APG89644.1 hypothetical protein SAMCFNEI73_Ch0312 [Sinorhizobium americanum]